MAQLKYEGQEVKVGGEVFIIPPLSFGILKRHKVFIESIGKTRDDGTSKTPLEDLPGICMVVHEAIKRNYPEITLEQVEDLIDMNNFGTIFNAIMQNSGLELAPPKLQPRAGKKEAPPLTSTISTQG